MEAETILEKYFPLVIVDEDEWAQHVVKAMYEFSKHQNKELIEENERLEYYETTTVGLWATDRPDLIIDPKNIMFELKTNKK